MCVIYNFLKWCDYDCDSSITYTKKTSDWPRNLIFTRVLIEKFPRGRPYKTYARTKSRKTDPSLSTNLQYIRTGSTPPPFPPFLKNVRLQTSFMDGLLENFGSDSLHRKFSQYSLC